MPNDMQYDSLSERSKRAHLRDVTKRVKGQAFNLLTEDIREPMQLALKALQREQPKLELVEYYIELSLSNIINNLHKFKQ